MSDTDKSELEEVTIFNSFGEWLEKHGVELSPMMVGSKFVAHIDLNELKPALLQVIYEKQAEAYRNGFLDGEQSEKVQALITQQCNQARKDEVRKLNGLNHRYKMSLASQHKIFDYINDRTAEIDAQAKETEDK